MPVLSCDSLSYGVSRLRGLLATCHVFLSVCSAFLPFPFKIRAQHGALLRVAVSRCGAESSLRRIIVITRDDSHISALVLFCKGCTLLLI